MLMAMMSGTGTGCLCNGPDIMNNGKGNSGINASTLRDTIPTSRSGSSSTSINLNTDNDDAFTSNAETLLSSNARFQAISAIAVAQDGVINVADQGMYI